MNIEWEAHDGSFIHTTTRARIFRARNENGDYYFTETPCRTYATLSEAMGMVQ